MHIKDWNSLKATFLENWPDPLRTLSVDQVDVPMDLAEASALGSNISELFEGFGTQPERDISNLTARVDAAVKSFPEGAFIKLGSRSPKDSWYGHRHGFRCCAGRDAIRLLTDCSERISDDLQYAIAQQYPPHIFVRRWHTIREWSEFRCFMMARKLVGISQYSYRQSKAFAEIAAKARPIEECIRRFFDLRFEPVCHLNDVVFDVFVTQESYRCGRGGTFWKATLLEINPFSTDTDPCLFAWDSENLDGSFRYLASSTDSNEGSEYLLQSGPAPLSVHDKQESAQ